jgi:hypothetical protein
LGPGADHGAKPVLDDATKAAVEILYKEYQRVQAKSIATDDWFFRFLSIAVIPFFAFLGYCAITPGYRILVAGLPVLSIIGLIVVAVLSSHYVYVNIYGDYLQREINRLLGIEVMKDTLFGNAAYEHFTPVRVGYVIGLGLLVIVNVLAGPFIAREVVRFRATHRAALGSAEWMLEQYWPFVSVFLLITSVAAVSSFIATFRRLDRLRTTHQVRQLGSTSTKAENTALAENSESGPEGDA